MGHKVTLSVIESSYRSTPTDEEWLAEVGESVARGLLVNDGGVAYFVDWQPSGWPKTFGWTAVAGASPEVLAYTRDMHVRSEAVASDIGIGVEAMEIYARGSYLCGTRESLGEDFGALETALGTSETRTGFGDSLNLVCMDATHRGVSFVHAVSTLVRTHPRVRERWAKVAAHVTAGLRLRRVAKGESLEADADAILDTAGHVLEAKANAVADREVLREAAKRVDRARLRGTEEDEALDLWQCLFSGEYSVVDCFDTDGKRLFVARRNPPQARGPRMLTDRERQVVALIGVGHSDKSAAYELGISEGTVASHLHVALRKLGLTSASDLGLLRARTHEVGE